MWRVADIFVGCWERLPRAQLDHFLGPPSWAYDLPVSSLIQLPSLYSKQMSTSHPCSSHRSPLLSDTPSSLLPSSKSNRHSLCLPGLSSGQYLTQVTISPLGLV